MVDKTLSGDITVTTAGTAVQGPATPEGAGDKRLAFYLKADPGNSGVVYVGNDGAGDVTSSNGYPLSAGESVLIEVNGLDQLYFDAASSGDSIRWIRISS